MVIEFQIRKGKRILSRHKDKKSAGRFLARKLFNDRSGKLSLVEVRGVPVKKKLIRR